VHGYKDALNVIHESGSKLSVSEETILRLHKLTRGEIWDAGQFKDRNGDIIERYANGRSRVRFKPIAASQTPEALRELLRSYERCTLEQWVHPIVALAAFNLDFLCIHPFRDGNGRVSRLLLLLQCYHHSLEVGRYISLERLIEQNKERYYETLELSSQQWHQGKHDPWQYINVVLYTLKVAYYEFESRVGQTREVQRARRRNWSLRQSKIHRHSFARRTYN
jgi:Fic family protein